MTSQKGTKKNGVEILIVEDSPTQAAKLKFFLEQHDYQVSVANNGKEAIASMSKRKPTIAISDIIMPEMDGYELCRQIKADENLKDIPVILLTSLSDPEDIVRSLECGADNFITKPYEEKYLLSRINYIIANRELRKSEKLEIGIESLFAGQKYVIKSGRRELVPLRRATSTTLAWERPQKAKGAPRGLRYPASVPLRIGDRMLGLMNLAGAEQGLFSDEDLKILNGVGHQITTALGRAELYENLEREVEERTAALTAEIAERERGKEVLREALARSSQK